MNKQKPKIDFFCVGAPKTGTTWLAKCLAEHPEVCVSSPKEPNFFNKKNFFFIKNQTWKLKDAEYGWPWYEKCFSHCQPGQIAGEFSVAYLYDPLVPRLIKENYPNAKIIIILRHPTDLYKSHYFHIRSQWDLPPLEKSIKNENGFIQYGFYSQYIKNYLDFFDKKNILFLFYEDLKKDDKKFFQKVCHFLNINENFEPENLKKIINATAPKTVKEIKAFFILRNKIIKLSKNFFLRHPILMKIALKIDAFIRKIIYSLAKRKKSYTELPPKIKKELDKKYSREIKNLEDILKIDLKIWKNE